MNKDTLRKYRCQHIYESRFGNPHYTWVAIGAKGAVHLHITDSGEEHGKKYGSRYHGGIEIHWRQPPEYMADQPPSQDVCCWMKCPCWHDGSSLAAEEIWIPRWERDPHSHDEMFGWLAYEAEQRFAEELIS